MVLTFDPQVWHPAEPAVEVLSTPIMSETGEVQEEDFHGVLPVRGDDGEDDRLWEGGEFFCVKGQFLEKTVNWQSTIGGQRLAPLVVKG